MAELKNSINKTDTKKESQTVLEPETITVHVEELHTGLEPQPVLENIEEDHQPAAPFSAGDPHHSIYEVKTESDEGSKFCAYCRDHAQVICFLCIMLSFVVLVYGALFAVVTILDGPRGALILGICILIVCIGHYFYLKLFEDN
jgi:hypothetical protein